MDFKKYESKSLPTLGSLKDFVELMVKDGYKIFKPPKEKQIVHLGKNARPQILFRNDENKQIELYISFKLDEKLTKGESVNIMECPVYVIDSGENKELVLGINAGELGSIDINDYSKAELSDLFMNFYRRK